MLRYVYIACLVIYIKCVHLKNRGRQLSKRSVSGCSMVYKKKDKVLFVITVLSQSSSLPENPELKVHDFKLWKGILCLFC